METQIEQPKYTTIIHRARINLELTCNEYCLADLIYHLSNNPAAQIKGWCFASKATIGEYLGLSTRTIHDILRKLITKNLIEKNPDDSSHLKTTLKWYENVVIERIKIKPSVKSEETSHIVQKVHTHSEDTAHYNNNIIYNNNYNNISKEIGLTPEKKGNQEINVLIDILKSLNSISSLDGTIAENRRYAYLLIKHKIEKEYQSRMGRMPSPGETISSFKAIIAKADRFTKNKLTNFKYIYYHFGELVNSVQNARRRTIDL